MTTKTRSRADKNIFERGGSYGVRWRELLADGRWVQRSMMVGPSKREANRVLAEKQVAGRQPHKVVEKPGMTLETFLVDHYLPSLDVRIEGTGNLERSSATPYRRYVKNDIVPAIGALRLDQISTARINLFLANLRVSGGHPMAGQGRPRPRVEAFYSRIPVLRRQGISLADVAALLTREFPQYGTTTKAMVSRIEARATEHQHLPPPAGRTANGTDHYRTMLMAEWKYGVSANLIPREKDHIMRATDKQTPSSADKAKLKQAKTSWTPEQYAAFFTWVAEARPDSYPKWLFMAGTGERREGVIPMRWSDIDLDVGPDYGIAHLTRFMADDKDKRDGRYSAFVKDYDKNHIEFHDLILDRLTVAVLRQWKKRQAEALIAIPERHTCRDVQRPCSLKGYHSRGLVFPTTRNDGNQGNYYTPECFSKLFKQHIASYNKGRAPADQLPDIHVHSLRHGWSTQANLAGVTQTLRMKALNQSSPAVNDGYTGAPDDAQVQAANATMTQIFGNTTLLQRALQ